MLMSPGQLLTNQIDSISTTSTDMISHLSSTNQNEFNFVDKSEYLTQLLKDKKQLSTLPNMFIHVERLLNQEINKIQIGLFNMNPRLNIDLPDPNGEKKIFQDKIPIPVQQYPDFNFVGRILGPRGMTAKELEAETGCKIMVRGRGSMRDKQKEDQNRGKPNWEHLDEDLHVLIQCEDYENRALIKLERAKENINKLLKPTTEGEDDLKKEQLTKLAIINGTYREPHLIGKKFSYQNNSLSIGAPLILTPSIQQNFLNGQIQSTPTPTIFTTNQTQSTLTTLPQTGDLNFVQVFTPLHTIDQMGLTNGTQLFDYQNQFAFPFLPSSTSAGLTTSTITNNSAGKITSQLGSTASARYQPYSIQHSRVNRT